LTWVTKTSAYNVNAGEGVFADTLTTGAFSITLPGSPSVGNIVGINDCKSNFATANLTVARNGNPIQGSANDLTCDVDDIDFQLIYTGATMGWMIQNTGV